MSQTEAEWRAEKLAAFEDWAERVKPEELTMRDRSEEFVKLLDDDPEVDRLIEEARRNAYQDRRDRVGRSRGPRSDC